MTNHIIAQPTPAAEFRSRAVIIILLVIAVILVAVALKETYVVTMPLVYAFFLAMLVRPVQVKLNHVLPYRLRWLSLVVTMLLILSVLAVAIIMVWISINLFGRTVSMYTERFSHYWDDFVAWTDYVGLTIPRNFFESEAVHGVIVGFGAYIVTSLWSLLVLLAVVLFLTLLMLLEVRDWQRKIRQALPRENGETFIATLNIVGEKIRHYLFVQTFIGLMAAILAGIWLWLIGVDFALLWAVLFFVLNYIPNVGPVLGGIPPVVMALIQFNLGWAILASAGLLFIQQVMGNFIEPRMLGRALQLSPTFLVISIFVWGWIWGAAGAIAAVPIMVTILILFAHIPFLRPVALMLSKSVEEPVVKTPAPEPPPKPPAPRKETGRRNVSPPASSNTPTDSSLSAFTPPAKGPLTSSQASTPSNSCPCRKRPTRTIGVISPPISSPPEPSTERTMTSKNSSTTPTASQVPARPPRGNLPAGSRRRKIEDGRLAPGIRPPRSGRGRFQLQPEPAGRPRPISRAPPRPPPGRVAGVFFPGKYVMRPGRLNVSCSLTLRTCSSRWEPCPKRKGTANETIVESH